MATRQSNCTNRTRPAAKPLRKRVQTARSIASIPRAIRDLTKELFSFQDKRLLGIDFTDIAMLSVKTSTENMS